MEKQALTRIRRGLFLGDQLVALTLSYCCSYNKGEALFVPRDFIVSRLSNREVSSFQSLQRLPLALLFRSPIILDRRSD